VDYAEKLLPVVVMGEHGVDNEEVNYDDDYSIFHF